MLRAPRVTRRTVRAGGALAKMLALLALAAAAIFLLYDTLNRARRAKACEENLRKIFRAIELHEMDRGVLPSLAYYPDEPRENTESLRVALENYGVDADACVCPAMPATLRDTGLTYIWNPALNGQKLPAGAPVWMVVDMTALSADLPPPHRGGYHVLYSDGSVKRISDPLRQLRGL